MKCTNDPLSLSSPFLPLFDFLIPTVFVDSVHKLKHQSRGSELLLKPFFTIVYL